MYHIFLYEKQIIRILVKSKSSRVTYLNLQHPHFFLLAAAILPSELQQQTAAVTSCFCHSLKHADCLLMKESNTLPQSDALVKGKRQIADVLTLVFLFFLLLRVTLYTQHKAKNKSFKTLYLERHMISDQSPKYAIYFIIQCDTSS